MAALPNDLINYLTVKDLALLVTGGAVAASLKAVFNAGRTIVQLAAVSDATLVVATDLFVDLSDKALNQQQAITTANALPASDFRQDYNGNVNNITLEPNGIRWSSMRGLHLRWG